MIGDTVGKYRIIEKLGEGGMGVVYLAEHTLMGSKAAVKVLLPELSSNAQIVQRFFNEAKAATKIDHPGIIKVFDFGHRDDGSAYIVMEYLVGENMGSRLRTRGKLGVREALKITRLCAGVLRRAHEAGIVHRDLKPDNIHLVPDPDVEGGERIKLLDFGIAKLADDGTSGLKTKTGAVFGTPAYMAPEQCEGAGKVDHRADVYSLGCILFELLSGRPPFVAEGTGRVLAAQIYETPPPITQLVPDLDAEVERLVARLLAKDPNERLQTMRELVDAIDVYLRDGNRDAAKAAPAPEAAKAPTPEAAKAPPPEAWAALAPDAAKTAPDTATAAPTPDAAKAASEPPKAAPATAAKPDPTRAKVDPARETTPDTRSEAAKIAPAAARPVPTTLSGSVGQATPLDPPKPKRGLWIAGGAVVAGVVVIAFVAAGGGSTDKGAERTTTTPTTPAAPDASPIPDKVAVTAPDVAPPAVAPPAVATPDPAWFEALSFVEELAGGRYPWLGNVSRSGDRVVLSMRLQRATSGKNQTITCGVEFGANGNPKRLADCVAQFADDHPRCAPGAQTRATGSVDVSCTGTGQSVACRTGVIQIATCDQSAGRWTDKSPVFEIRRAPPKAVARNDAGSAKDTTPATPIKAPDSADKRQRAETLVKDARRLGLQGNHAGAIAALTEAQTLGSDNPSIYLMLYTNHSRLGDNGRAAKALREYVRRRPDDPNVSSYRDIINQLETK